MPQDSNVYYGSRAASTYRVLRAWSEQEGLHPGDPECMFTPMLWKFSPMVAGKVTVAGKRNRPKGEGGGRLAVCQHQVSGGLVEPEIARLHRGGADAAGLKSALGGTHGVALDPQRGQVRGEGSLTQETGKGDKGAR